MELFINALFITFGILAALFIARVSYSLLQIFLNAAQRAVESKRREEVRKLRIARANERQAVLKKEVEEILESNKDVAALAAEIANTPYAGGRTKASRANNNKRSKLQKELRNLVRNKAHRDFIYEMSA